MWRSNVSWCHRHKSPNTYSKPSSMALIRCLQRSLSILSKVVGRKSATLSHTYTQSKPCSIGSHPHAILSRHKRENTGLITRSTLVWVRPTHLWFSLSKKATTSVIYSALMAREILNMGLQRHRQNCASHTRVRNIFHEVGKSRPLEPECVLVRRSIARALWKSSARTSAHDPHTLFFSNNSALCHQTDVIARSFRSATSRRSQVEGEEEKRGKYTFTKFYKRVPKCVHTFPKIYLQLRSPGMLTSAGRFGPAFP